MAVQTPNLVILNETLSSSEFGNSRDEVTVSSVNFMVQTDGNFLSERVLLISDFNLFGLDLLTVSQVIVHPVIVLEVVQETPVQVSKSARKEELSFSSRNSPP